MTDNTQPEALDLADVLEAVEGGWSVADKCCAELRRQHARIAELEAHLSSSGFTAADMATAESRGFRDGVASTGSEPVAWRAQFDAWWARNRVSTHQVKNIGGFAAKVWHAAIQTVVGATDSTAGFYPADEGSTTSRQATHPSPQEGMVGGWQSIATAPKEGVFLVYMQEEVRPARRMAVANWHPNVKTVGGLFSFDCATVTHWMPLPPPPTTSAGSGKGE